jgi:hypothetical protein
LVHVKNTQMISQYFWTFCQCSTQKETSQMIEAVTAIPDVQAAAKNTIRRESQSLNRSDDSIDRQGTHTRFSLFHLQAKSLAVARKTANTNLNTKRSCLVTCRNLDQQTEEVLRLRGGAGGNTEAGEPAAAGGPMPFGSDQLKAYWSPHMKQAAQAEQARSAESSQPLLTARSASECMSTCSV